MGDDFQDFESLDNFFYTILVLFIQNWSTLNASERYAENQCIFHALYDNQASFEAFYARTYLDITPRLSNKMLDESLQMFHTCFMNLYIDLILGMVLFLGIIK